MVMKLPYNFLVHRSQQNSVICCIVRFRILRKFVNFVGPAVISSGENRDQNGCQRQQADGNPENEEKENFEDQGVAHAVNFEIAGFGSDGELLVFDGELTRRADVL
jgi:hypothetical protein